MFSPPRRDFKSFRLRLKSVGEKLSFTIPSKVGRFNSNFLLESLYFVGIAADTKIAAFPPGKSVAFP
jgi:hypothetical protein